MPRMAFQDAFDGEPGATERTMSGDGFRRVVRAGRIKAALGAEKRAQRDLIATDCEQQQAFHPNKYIC